MLLGSEHDDTLTASDDGNSISGGGGADTIVGGSGNDWLEGNAGADKLTGNDGEDIFVISSASGGADTVTDFTKGEDKLFFEYYDPASVITFADAGLSVVVRGNDTHISLANNLVMILTGVTDTLDLGTDVEII